MQAATYIALSSQMALSRQMDIVANNIANASTPAFRGERVIFAEFLDARAAGTPLSFVQDFGTARDTRQGPLTRTGNSLDLALEGDGFLKVATPFGTRYTRNGRFQLDPQGQLVTAQGYAVLGDGDQPINLPTDARDLTVTRDGAITTAQGEAGRLSVVRFEKESDLVPAAGGLYVTAAPPLPAETTSVVQGMIEDSNVQPVIEMTRLMTIARNYASAKDLLDGENDRLRGAIDKLGKVA